MTVETFVDSPRLKLKTIGQVAELIEIRFPDKEAKGLIISDIDGVGSLPRLIESYRQLLESRPRTELIFFTARPLGFSLKGRVGSAIDPEHKRVWFCSDIKKFAVRVDPFVIEMARTRDWLVYVGSNKTFDLGCFEEISSGVFPPGKNSFFCQIGNHLFL